MALIRKRLKERRLAMGLTLQEVADFVGVEKATVQRYESGVIKNVDTLTVEKLAKKINCDPAYLMGWTDEVMEFKAYHYTEKEHNLIKAYRGNPTMQGAIDKILNINESDEKQ